MNFAQEKASSEKTSKPDPSKKKKSKKQREIPIVDPANVTDIRLSRTEIPANCSAQDNSCTQIIEVLTVGHDNGDGGVVYVYTVSGGKIIGSGAMVKWDLSGVKPETYTITAGIDSGTRWGVLGRTETREIKVVE
jgi:hypothetical protein